MRRNIGQQGFTIVELMIATAVFAVVLLLCTYGMLEIGRTYYKGMTTTRTQEAARRIIDDVSESIKFSGGQVWGSESSGWYCVGAKRYSFRRGVQRTDTTRVIVSDEQPACNGGTGSQNLNGTLASGSTELLDNRMYLSDFSITPVTGMDGLYQVTVRVASGDSDLFTERGGGPGVSAADAPLECRTVRVGSQFCAVTQLSTTVQKRL